MKKENKKIITKETLSLKEFMLLDEAHQEEKMAELIENIYDKKVNVSKKYIEKALNAAFDQDEEIVSLPKGLEIVRKEDELLFCLNKTNNAPLFIAFLLGFALIAGFATYTGVQYISKSKLNIDLNGDNIPDLNLDLKGDGLCEVNCDTDNDNKPDINIDYQGNQQPIFNVSLEDGTIKNKMNQLNKDGVCYINCDTNEDGWPDINIDIDGDGTPDINIDVDGDGKPDLNIDTNRDGKADVNIDVAGDGKCDKNCISSSTKNIELNIDLNSDGKCDVNCDTDEDGKPNTNIDYRGDKNPIFNVLEDGVLKNKINNDTNNDNICDLNCDTNNDGWPETNIDIDGDGKPDLNIDTNNDGFADLNIDTDNDKTCNMNCDKDGDGVCDYNCTVIVLKSPHKDPNKEGNNGVDYQAAVLKVIFSSNEKIVANNIYPDDQASEGKNTKIPDMKFVIENSSDSTLYYDISMVNVENTYVTDNFRYKITSTNNGFTKDWTSAPKERNSKINSNRVAIAAHTKQEYVVSFTLHGTNAPQNEDQGKVFRANVEVTMVEE